MNTPGPKVLPHIAAHRRTLRRVGVCLAAAAFGLSMLSGDAKLKLHTKGALHPWLHLGLFFVLGALSVLSVLRTRMRLLLILATIALGVTIEFTEAWRFRESLETQDILVDICGTLLGGLVAWQLSRNLD